MSRARRNGPNVGRQIQTARKQAGLTQVALAERLGQAPRTVQAWEGNTRTPRTGALVELATVLGRPVSWFYEEGS